MMTDNAARWPTTLANQLAPVLAAAAFAAVLLFGALLTAIYMFTVVCKAFFPAAGSVDEKLASEREVNWRMTVPMVILAAGILLTGIYAQPIVNAAMAIAQGLR